MRILKVRELRLYKDFDRDAGDVIEGIFAPRFEEEEFSEEPICECCC